MRLEDKVAIITGGANGMGAEEARMFAREGATVVVADMRNEEGEAVVTQLAESGGTSVYVHTATSIPRLAQARAVPIRARARSQGEVAP